MKTKLTAPAKVNLGLSIVGRRLDGYHLLESLFWPIDLCDELILNPSDSFSVSARWLEPDLYAADLPQGEKNLVSKAASAIRSHFPNKPFEKSAVQIVKRIPLGSGMGGGSSDAGALLRYWREQNGIGEESVRAIAGELGADVTFFLDPVPAWVRGVGEQVLPLPVEPELIREISFLILIPSFASETRVAFQDFQNSKTAFDLPKPFKGEKLNWSSLEELLRESTNSLESAVGKRFPVITLALDAMRLTRPIYAGLSGSGSSCVAVYRSEIQCAKAAKVLQNFCRSYDCRSLRTKTFTKG